MSGDFNVAGDASVNMSAGAAGAVGSGAYTIALLVRPTTGNNNCGFMRCDASAVQQRGFFEDALALFGANDFSSGFGALTQGNWYVVAQSKAAGSNLFRFHVWAYASDGSGSMSHGTSVGAANQGDGSAIDAIRIGIADDRGNGLIAAVGLWTSALSDGQLDTLKSASLAAWSALSPAELISLENWNGSTGCTAVVGTSSQSSITGTVAVGANPPSFSFSLAAAAGPSAARTVPPPPLLHFLAARNQAMWRNGSQSTQDATVTASVVAGVTTVGTATVSTGSTVAGIATVAGVATIGTAGVTTPIPAVTVAGIATVGTATVATGSTVPAAVVAGTATVGTATVKTGSTVAPATVAGTATVGAATVTSSAAIAPATVAGTATIGSVTVTAVTAVSPATVAGTATVGAPTVKTGSTVVAANVAGIASIPAPSVSAGGNATVSPGVVAGIATVGSPTVGAGSTAVPATVAGAATVGTATVKTSVTLTLTTVAGVAAIATPAVSGAAPIPGALHASQSGPTLRASSARSGLHAYQDPS